ncbi:hypothetical protein [Bradyrhizobium uaiense]|uniref:hypothetical protein n=1 Tax=Bradyrhizobium uaiense TaxID=2594946 RepID=UPI0013D5B8FF|nr:hypothetical protein [Bradyrhizobium uaiense]
MTELRNRPLFTSTFENPGSFRPVDDSAYVFGLFEERSEHIQSWTSSCPSVHFVKITSQGRTSIETDAQGLGSLSLRNQSDLSRLFDHVRKKRIYLDITGLSHHVWAPLVRVALDKNLDLNVVYVEPANYSYSPSPRKGEIFDLSESIDGIAPIPLFATLNDTDEERVCFIALLGFEGTRFAYLVEQIDPPGGKIVPVIGVPGFQLEYPFHAYMGNQPALEQTRAWRNVHFARANCPFSLYYVLEDIMRRYSSDHIKIAPIGTKPHALGAVLLAITTTTRSIELVYDHPKRKPKRTTGALRLLVYAVSDFVR